MVDILTVTQDYKIRSLSYIKEKKSWNVPVSCRVGLLCRAAGVPNCALATCHKSADCDRLRLALIPHIIYLSQSMTYNTLCDINYSYYNLWQFSTTCKRPGEWGGPIFKFNKSNIQIMSYKFTYRRNTITRTPLRITWRNNKSKSTVTLLPHPGYFIITSLARVELIGSQF